jgi:hypothetical protein
MLALMLMVSLAAAEPQFIEHNTTMEVLGNSWVLTGDDFDSCLEMGVDGTKVTEAFAAYRTEAAEALRLKDASIADLKDSVFQMEEALRLQTRLTRIAEMNTNKAKQQRNLFIGATAGVGLTALGGLALYLFIPAQ